MQKKKETRPFYSISIQREIKTPFYVLYKSNVTLRPLIVDHSVRCGGRFFLKNQLKKMSHFLEIWARVFWKTDKNYKDLKQNQ